MADAFFEMTTTVIDGKPHKFGVSENEEVSADDFARDIKCTYRFEGTDQSDPRQNLRFSVRVTDETVRFNFSDDQQGLLNAVIAFGLHSIGQRPTDREFVLTTDELKRMREVPTKDGPELRTAMLEFIYAINSYWPDWSVSHVDLHDNLIGSEESASVWLNRLRSEGLLEAMRGFKRHSRARGKPDTKAYRIAAGAADKVKSELSSAKAEAEFPDNQFYHLIDLEVEASGPFAFVIMPFREEEFAQDVYERVIRSIVRDNLVCQCVRNDQDLWPGQLDDKFYSHIRKSDFLIAELTTENPNVVYELGLAHAYNKEVIVLVNESKRTEKLSFDYDKFSTVFYSDEDDLRSKLEPMIRSLGNKLRLLRE